jgi:hypothetical protein
MRDTELRYRFDISIPEFHFHERSHVGVIRRSIRFLLSKACSFHGTGSLRCVRNGLRSGEFHAIQKRLL